MDSQYVDGLTHFPVFAKNRRNTADVQWSVLCCPAVCREQAGMARKAQAGMDRKAQVFPGSVFPGSVFPSANSATTSQNCWRCLVQPSVQSRVRASAACPGALSSWYLQYLQGWRLTVFLGHCFNIWPPLLSFHPALRNPYIDFPHFKLCPSLPGHAKKSLCVSTPHPPLRRL